MTLFPPRLSCSRFLTVLAAATAVLSPADAEAWVFGNGFSIANRYSMSGGERYVTFESDATNLVPNDTNGVRDVFVLDTQTGSVVRVSVSTSGEQGNGSSMGPSISHDGTKIAFYSSATNLVAGDTNGSDDVFVRDLVAGTTVRASVSSAGGQSAGYSVFPSLSADGRKVAFESIASGLVAGDTNGVSDVFVRDLVAQTTVRGSVDSSGNPGGGASAAASISGDGARVAFHSGATNLVPDDTNGSGDVFVRDLTAGTTVRVSVDSSGSQAMGGTSAIPFISADGRKVAFEATATNLVGGDTNGVSDIFVHDLVTSETVRVSVEASAGGEGNGASTYCSLSADGGRVAFHSLATNLVAGDTNGQRDVFVRDLATGTTVRASVSTSGNQALLGASAQPSLAGEGTKVAFHSGAANLVPGDTNGQIDVFVRDLSSGMTEVPVSVSAFRVE